MTKRFFTVGLLIVLCAALIACGLVSDGKTLQEEPSTSPATPRAEKSKAPEKTAEPTPTPEPPPEPTPEPPKPFTILWIADTQNYAYMSDEGLISIVDYALKAKDELNIVAVLHSGDVVENNAKDEEWEKIAADVEPLRGNIPFYCVCGNHDLGSGTGISAVRIHGYEQYFKYDLCDARDDAQRYHNGECWYRFFEEQQFLLVGIGWHLGEEDPARLEWLDGVLDAYADYPALILTHNYLYNNGLLSKDGEKLERELISRHANVRLLLCGHHKGIRRLQTAYENGNRLFTAVMYNLQLDKENGTGYCTLMTFDPVSRSISFTSYSPYFDDYNYLNNPEKETFVLENVF